MTEQVSDTPLVNSIGSQTRSEGVTSVVKPKIHESRFFASVPPAGLDGIDVHIRLRIAEHEFFRSSILLRHHQFLGDNVIHGDRPSPTGLAFGDENRPSEKVHVSTANRESLRAACPC